MANQKFLLKGEDAQHLCTKGTELLCTPFLPSPHFGRDIVKDGSAGQCLVHKRENVTKVEPGVVDGYYNMWIEILDLLLHKMSCGANLGEVSQNRDKPHKGNLTVMDNRSPPRFVGHLISAHKCECSRRVFGFYGSDEVSTMKVSRSLSCYQEISHRGDVILFGETIAKCLMELRQEIPIGHVNTDRREGCIPFLQEIPVRIGFILCFYLASYHPVYSSPRSICAL